MHSEKKYRHWAQIRVVRFRRNIWKLIWALLVLYLPYWSYGHANFCREKCPNPHRYFSSLSQSSSFWCLKSISNASVSEKKWDLAITEMNFKIVREQKLFCFFLAPLTFGMKWIQTIFCTALLGERHIFREFDAKLFLVNFLLTLFIMRTLYLAF